jgi:hypothetical protein
VPRTRELCEDQAANAVRIEVEFGLSGDSRRICCWLLVVGSRVTFSSAKQEARWMTWLKGGGGCSVLDQRGFDGIVGFMPRAMRVEYLGAIYQSWATTTPGRFAAKLPSKEPTVRRVCSPCPAARLFLPSRIRPSRQAHGSLTVAPLIADQRCYGVTPVRLRWC